MFLSTVWYKNGPPFFIITVDASLPADQREQRTVLRSKYIGRPRTAAIMQYDGHEVRNPKCFSLP